MKNFLLGVVATLVVLVAGTFAYLWLGLAEVRADAAPSAFESYVMSKSVHASVRRHAPEIASPIAPTDQNLIEGGKIYAGECSGCHGTPGSTGHGDVLYPPIPQVAVVGTTYSEAQIFWVAKHGIRRTGMFANGKWDEDERLWTVAAYIKRMNALPEAVQEALKPKPQAEAKDSTK